MASSATEKNRAGRTFERRAKAIELLRHSPAEMVTAAPDKNAEPEAVMVRFRKRVQELRAEVADQLGPPSQEELVLLAQRVAAKQTF